MNVLTALAGVVAELLREDVRRVLLGEDVRSGGMLGLSRAAMDDPTLGLRVLGTPLTPAAGLAHATGLALAGRRPIVLLPSATALLEGYAALRELGRVAATAGGERSAPVLIVAPTGPGFGLGGDAADAPDGAIAGIPGLRVVVLGDVAEAAATLRAAAGFDDGDAPTVLLLPRALVLREIDKADLKDSLGRPLGAARTIREGAAATVFAIGAAVDQAYAAAEQSGVDVAVVEVSGLAPLDEAGIVAAATSGKLVVAHAGGRAYGPGAELVALLADQAILRLDAPVLRVTGEVGPHTGRDEHAGLPSVEAIAAAIVRVATY
jgi:pyruvate/2-oxoglutarate/acetoin dehydrogenase E1 component